MAPGWRRRQNWPYRTWLALIHTGDNHGPPKPEEVSQLLAEAKAQLPGVQVRIGRLSDFCRCDRWPRTLPSRLCVATCPTPGFTARCAIRKAPDWPATFVRRSGPPSRSTRCCGCGACSVDDAAPTIAAAYEKSLLYGEHTWGGALAWVSIYDRPLAMSYGDDWQQQRAAGKFARLEASWAEHTAYIEAARDLVQPLLAQPACRPWPARCTSKGIVSSCSTRFPGSAMDWCPSAVARREAPGLATGGWRLRCFPSVADQDMRFNSLRATAGLGYRTYVVADAAAGRRCARAATHSSTRCPDLISPWTLDPARGVIRAADRQTTRVASGSTARPLRRSDSISTNASTAIRWRPMSRRTSRSTRPGP